MARNFVEKAPVNEKYAGVVYAGETLPRVNGIVAGRLCRCGFPQEGYPMMKGKDDQMFAQPLFAEVIQWLKREHGIIINTYNRCERLSKDDGEHYEYVCIGEEWFRTIYVPQDGRLVQFKRPIYPFLTEEDAQAIAIREAVNYLRLQLKKENNYGLAA